MTFILQEDLETKPSCFGAFRKGDPDCANCDTRSSCAAATDDWEDDERTVTIGHSTPSYSPSSQNRRFVSTLRPPYKPAYYNTGGNRDGYVQQKGRISGHLQNWGLFRDAKPWDGSTPQPWERFLANVVMSVGEAMFMEVLNLVSEFRNHINR